jgi:hypothetical protein
MRNLKVLSGACASLLLAAGCFPVGESCATALTVRGEVRDAQTNEPIADSPIGGRTITDGLITDGGPAVDSQGEPVRAFTEADGTFALNFALYFYEDDVPEPCEFPPPERVQIIVVRDDCEQRVMVEISNETAQFFDGPYPDDLLELTAPVLVPPCDEVP